MKIIINMRSVCRLLPALFMVLLAVPPVHAQVVPQELTLKDAINYALENKAEARKAKLSVENSEYQIQEVRARALPTITANGNLTYNPILQLNALPGEFFGGGCWSGCGHVAGLLSCAVKDRAPRRASHRGSGYWRR